MRDRGSAIGDQGLEMRNQGSGIRDQGSGIRDQGLEISAAPLAEVRDDGIANREEHQRTPERSVVYGGPRAWQRRVAAVGYVVYQPAEVCDDGIANGERQLRLDPVARLVFRRRPFVSRSNFFFISHAHARTRLEHLNSCICWSARVCT